MQLAKRIRNAASMIEFSNENSMSAALLEPLTELLPAGVSIIFDKTRGDHGDRPDLSLQFKGADVGYIEVKRPDTLKDAFKTTTDGSYQVQSYRKTQLPVLLTDGLRWFDVTDANLWNPSTASDLLEFPYVDFAIDYEDDLTVEKLRVLLSVAAKVRPNYSQGSAPIGMAMLVDRINDNHTASLEAAWGAARQILGMTAKTPDLGDGKVGEIIAFTLLAIAAKLPVLGSNGFIAECEKEWNQNRSWSTGDLPLSLSGCLRDFRQADGESSGRLLGTSGWAVIRSIALGLNVDGEFSWDRLSALWDSYLNFSGMRQTLGSWQTPAPVARFQAQLASDALQTLGYHGLNDPKVTIIDPCCGTGVYLQEVVEQVKREGGAPASLSRTTLQNSRLIGCDISPAAVAASHIRLTTLDVHANLYMTDTLSASPQIGSGRGVDSPTALFDWGPDTLLSALVSAVKSDELEMSRWADRSGDRDPILTVIGNPPYLRGGLDEKKYSDRAWYGDYFKRWKSGSGGGGSLQDLFVGFLAWAFRIADLDHDSFISVKPHGVVTFITNRAWIDGSTFKPLRDWLRTKAVRVDIFDFGPGSRGNSGAQWSSQPFAIETGTAIFCAIFGDAQQPAEVRYTKIKWEASEISILSEPAVIQSNEDWTGKTSAKVLFEPRLTTAGVKTGSDKTWVKVMGDRDFPLRHAYRAFDNRYIPEIPPTEGLTAGARWREAKLFEPYKERLRQGCWYLIGPTKSSLPGPALHASMFIPGNDSYKGSEGGYVLPITDETPIPADYALEAERLNLSTQEFWYCALALGNNGKYWRPGNDLSAQLAENKVELEFSIQLENVKRLVEIGRHLVRAWSLDYVEPIGFTGEPGAWHFESHDEADAIKIHGRKVLKEWRKAREGAWTKSVATEYARTISGLLIAKRLGEEVENLTTI